MIWMAIRQHRTAFVTIAVLFVMLIIAVLVLSIDINRLASITHVTMCEQAPLGSNCAARVRNFLFGLDPFTSYPIVLNLLPTVVGAFIGAPLLAREYEQGTFRFAWTQSITRLVWYGGHVGVILAVLIVGTAALQLFLTWTMAPVLDLGAATGLGEYWMQPFVFDVFGATPVLYMVFSVGVGFAVGGIVKRTLPAILMTLVLFVAVRLGVDAVVRPHFLPPLTTVVSYHAGTRDFLHGVLIMKFTPLGPVHCGPKGCFQLQRIVYQPDSRFGVFQLIESVIYGALSIMSVWIGLVSVHLHGR